ncbi:MAG: tRNA (cytidine(34)-2'-O)-methyltransferase [Lachnospiraceae bacterium]|nr:tRNA (cytidine(34)-2'-O)-methyltransferase [Lachnospiraceae bacterium]
MMKIVLHEPGIALNTGNIGRTCAATDTELHLIRPYGFVISQKEIKRAGMDYWDKVKLFQYVDYEDFLEKNSDAFANGARLWYATTKARQAYTDVSYGPDDFIMLGNESRGIPEEILVEHPDTCVRIPMWGEIRSLNLANSAAIILYEALRQNGFPELSGQGELHRLHW